MPGLELKAEGTMINTTDTTVLFKSQFVELNPLSAALLFANTFNENGMRPRKWPISYIKKEVKKSSFVQFISCFSHD